MRKPLALGLLVLLLAGQAVLPAEEAKPESDRMRKALERSLLFPGLGQLYEKQYAKAALFAAAEIFCLTQVVINARKGNDAYRNYRNADDIASAMEQRRRTQRFDRRRNIAILAASGVWVLNMVDIFVYAKKKYGRERSAVFHPFYQHENQAYGVGITCCF